MECIYYHGVGFNCESQLQQILGESLPGNPEHWIFHTASERWPLPLQNMPDSPEEMFYVSPPEVRNVLPTQTPSLNSSQWIYDARIAHDFPSERVPLFLVFFLIITSSF